MYRPCLLAATRRRSRGTTRFLSTPDPTHARSILGGLLRPTCANVSTYANKPPPGTNIKRASVGRHERRGPPKERPSKLQEDKDHDRKPSRGSYAARDEGRDKTRSAPSSRGQKDENEFRASPRGNSEGGNKHSGPSSKWRVDEGGFYDSLHGESAEMNNRRAPPSRGNDVRESPGGGYEKNAARGGSRSAPSSRWQGEDNDMRAGKSAERNVGRNGLRSGPQSRRQEDEDDSRMPSKPRNDRSTKEDRIDRNLTRGTADYGRSSGEASKRKDLEEEDAGNPFAECTSYSSGTGDTTIQSRNADRNRTGVAGASGGDSYDEPSCLDQNPEEGDEPHLERRKWIKKPKIKPKSVFEDTPVEVIWQEPDEDGNRRWRPASKKGIVPITEGYKINVPMYDSEGNPSQEKRIILDVLFSTWGPVLQKWLMDEAYNAPLIGLSGMQRPHYTPGTKNLNPIHALTIATPQNKVLVVMPGRMTRAHWRKFNPILFNKILKNENVKKIGVDINDMLDRLQVDWKQAFNSRNYCGIYDVAQVLRMDTEFYDHPPPKRLKARKHTVSYLAEMKERQIKEPLPDMPPLGKGVPIVDPKTRMLAERYINIDLQQAQADAKWTGNPLQEPWVGFTAINAWLPIALWEAGQESMAPPTFLNAVEQQKISKTRPAKGEFTLKVQLAMKQLEQKLAVQKQLKEAGEEVPFEEMSPDEQRACFLKRRANADQLEQKSALRFPNPIPRHLTPVGVADLKKQAKKEAEAQAVADGDVTGTEAEDVDEIVEDEIEEDRYDYVDAPLPTVEVENRSQQEKQYSKFILDSGEEDLSEDFDQIPHDKLDDEYDRVADRFDYDDLPPLEPRDPRDYVTDSDFFEDTLRETQDALEGRFKEREEQYKKRKQKGESAESSRGQK
ncbi:uncharacterized protein EV422DRAFT_517147 [Fimicolochytrium jonesii]|uniref:uncharacterized protein n=1 Tax=Fimicolochytrium jonesii TaxID=1396493 RepID=UPI0022FE320A|nr:uncharacterized protein EV422DRAFT_517147 [Fimicolochytrium jonesii]KAI8825018.1 hypothetical protein EV422DRAFT_517147 [Fimicolochytrium jonesii]